MEIYEIAIDDPTYVAGITAAREAYNAGLAFDRDPPSGS